MTIDIGSGGGSEETTCSDTNPEGTTDANGNTCADAENDFMLCYDDEAVTDEFDAAIMCCACGGGTNSCFDTDYGETDDFGYDCGNLYNDQPAYCGNYDSATFSANLMCCGCGGGSTYGGGGD